MFKNLIYIAAFFSSCVLSTEPSVQKNTNLQRDEFSEWILTKNIKSSESKWSSREGEYQLRRGECVLNWNVVEARDDGHLHLYQRSHSESSGCPDHEVKVVGLNRKILKQILVDWDKSKITGLSMGSLDLIPLRQDESLKLAVASDKSSDYLDYRKNYPNHKSRKSINAILVEIVNSEAIGQSLINLFGDLGLKVTLNSCEKVFAFKAQELPFSKKLPKTLLDQNKTLISGAGIYYFKVGLLSNR